jgi:hypothetical protein
MLATILLIILALLLIGALPTWSGAGVPKNRTATGRMPGLRPEAGGEVPPSA